MQAELFAPEPSPSTGGAELIRRLTGEPENRVAELVQSFGGAAPILAAEPSRLRREGLSEAAIEALGAAKAAAACLLESRIAAEPVLSCWEALLDYLRAEMAWEPVERVRVFYLNGKNRLIANEAAGTGTVDEAPFFVREIIHRALDLGATALIVAHNHPSGDPAPSSPDVKITRQLIDAGRPLGIAVHDHVIVGRDGHASLRALGLLG